MATMATNKAPINNVILPAIRRCSYSHDHCKAIADIGIKNIPLVTQTYFNDYLKLIRGANNHTNCISRQTHDKREKVVEFITLCSRTLNVHNNSWEFFASCLTDHELFIIIQNQLKIRPVLIEEFIASEYTGILHHGRKNFINFMMESVSRIRTFAILIESMNVQQFTKFLKKMKYFCSTAIDNVLVKFIEKNKNNINANVETLNIMFECFKSNLTIMKEIYKIFQLTISNVQKKILFQNALTCHNHEIIFLLIKNNDYVPSNDDIDKLIEKCYCTPDGCNSAGQIAQILDLLIDCDLTVTKELIIKLISHGCYINQIEKYGVIIDNDILMACSKHSYYPYKFDVVPSTQILIRECSKQNNLVIIKKLKEFGANFTTECLEEACKLPRNGKVIKYLLTDCKVSSNTKCLANFQDSYKLDGLIPLMENYSLNNDKNKTDETTNKNFMLDNESVMTVKPKNVQIDINDNTEYQIKTKIKKFFGIKTDTLIYAELHRIVLKYLITNKLVIGTYFIINLKLSELLKINQCTILHIDQINNIITYFIELN